MITKEGGLAFLDSLTFTNIPHYSKDAYDCPVCGKNARSQRSSYTITNNNGIRLIIDRFNKSKCAKRGIAWLYYIYKEFKKFINYENDRELTIVDLDDPWIKDRLKKFNSPRFAIIQNLKKFVPETDDDEL